MSLEIVQLESVELDEADRIYRLAFATVLGLADPAAAFGARDPLRTRWRAGNTFVLSARKDGQTVGSNVLTRWGSLGWFGPMSVRPDLWNQGVARALLGETSRIFDRWGVSHRGLFTFSHSPKHLSLYERSGFWPRYLTVITEKSLPSREPESAGAPACRLFSQLGTREAGAVVQESSELSEGALPGLDLGGEIRSVLDQKLGDTLLLQDGSTLEGFAICHVGAGTEAGTGSAYLKFALVRPGSGGPGRLAALLSGAESYAISRGATCLKAGVNMSHPETFRVLRNCGYKGEFVGVVMQSPNEPGYHRPEVTLIDDWR